MMLQRMHIFPRLTLRDCRIRVCAHAEGFEKRQVPFGSQPQIASVAESRINRIHSRYCAKRLPPALASCCLRKAAWWNCGCSSPEHEDISERTCSPPYVP